MLLLLVACISLTPVASEVLVDEVVAVVNRHVITRSEILEEAVFVLVDRRGQAGLKRQLTPKFLSMILSMLINQHILLDEARRLGLPSVSDKEREQLLQGFKTKFSSAEDYTRFLYENGITEQVISDALVRHFRVEMLKQKKMHMVSEPTQDEIRKYYFDHKLDFGGADIKAVSNAIKISLSQKRQDRELARWISELGKRADVKVLVDLSEGTGSTNER